MATVGPGCWRAKPRILVAVALAKPDGARRRYGTTADGSIPVGRDKIVHQKPVEDVGDFVDEVAGMVWVANGENRSETCEYALTPGSTAAAGKSRTTRAGGSR